MEHFAGLTKEALTSLLTRIQKARVGLLGDICLDAYWEADMRLSELSKETPHFPLPVVRERTSPGAGGNVAMNLHALGVNNVQVISAIGNDWRGHALCACFETAGIDTSYILRDSTLVTNAYIKPLRAGISDVVYEDPRIDFTNYAPISADVEARIIDALDTLAPSLDALCVSDQFHFGLITDPIRRHLEKLSARGLTIVADSRYSIGKYRGIYIKPNASEGLTAAGYPANENQTTEVCAAAANRLVVEGAKAVIMTLGAEGALFTDDNVSTTIPSHKVSGPVDICGAGDTFLSGFTAAMAAGASPQEAASLGSLCSEVTIQQLGTTGTASPGQVMERYCLVAEEKPYSAT